ncbi:MAG TPA: hypothetical protein VF062_11815 [Candidatus Limnocylindrales bacterium]
MIITFRLSDHEFEEHFAHRKNCQGCGDLAHLYLAVADLAYVKVFVDRVRVHPPPNRFKLVDQLIQRQTALARRRLADHAYVTRQRLLRELERRRQDEVSAIIRSAWNRQEEQEWCEP